MDTPPFGQLSPVGSDPIRNPIGVGNVAQDRTYDDDPHEWVRRTPAARAMKSAFLSFDSRIVDTCVSYCDTYNYPFVLTP